MTIVYKILSDGGFVIGDTETRYTSYSYPSSKNAVEAMRLIRIHGTIIRPNKIDWIDIFARGCLGATLAFRSPTGEERLVEIEYDDRNWKLLEPGETK